MLLFSGNVESAVRSDHAIYFKHSTSRQEGLLLDTAGSVRPPHLDPYCTCCRSLLTRQPSYFHKTFHSLFGNLAPCTANSPHLSHLGNHAFIPIKLSRECTAFATKWGLLLAREVDLLAVRPSNKVGDITGSVARRGRWGGVVERKIRVAQRSRGGITPPIAAAEIGRVRCRCSLCGAGIGRFVRITKRRNAGWTRVMHHTPGECCSQPW